MDARLERKLRRLAGVVVAGAIAGIVFSVAQRHGSVRSVVVGISYGVSISASLGFIEYFVLEGPLQRPFVRNQPDRAERNLRSGYCHYPGIGSG